MNQSLEESEISCYGHRVDLIASGEGIRGADAQSGVYRRTSGTSHLRPLHILLHVNAKPQTGTISKVQHMHHSFTLNSVSPSRSLQSSTAFLSK